LILLYVFALVNTFFAGFEVCEDLETQCGLGSCGNGARFRVYGLRCTVYGIRIWI
jgi:hypothetical protein